MFPKFMQILPEILYTIRSILLVANMDVSRHILVFNTFIIVTNKTSQREYYIRTCGMFGCRHELII
jgi:hypothetical protein